MNALFFKVTLAITDVDYFIVCLDLALSLTLALTAFVPMHGAQFKLFELTLYHQVAKRNINESSHIDRWFRNKTSSTHSQCA